MIITINEESLTAVIVDDADAPTKKCVLGNWNPATRQKWSSVYALKSYAELIQNNDNFFSEVIVEEPVAEEPVAQEPIAEEAEPAPE